jgi:hypothetical protein
MAFNVVYRPWASFTPSALTDIPMLSGRVYSSDFAQAKVFNSRADAGLDAASHDHCEVWRVGDWGPTPTDL